jgi:hypothetical protein
MTYYSGIAQGFLLCMLTYELWAWRRRRAAAKSNEQLYKDWWFDNDGFYDKVEGPSCHDILDLMEAARSEQETVH